MKIDPVKSETFGEIQRLLLHQKSQNLQFFYHRSFRITGPNLTKFVQNVEKSLLFNLLTSELQCFNPFRDADLIESNPIRQTLRHACETQKQSAFCSPPVFSPTILRRRREFFRRTFSCFFCTCAVGLTRLNSRSQHVT